MKCIICGTGNKAHRALTRLKDKYGIDTVAFLDETHTDCALLISCGVPIIDYHELKDYDYDKIFISFNDIQMTNHAISKLIENGISRQDIEPLLYTHDYIDVFADKRIEWFRCYARYAVEQNLAGSIVECGVNKGETAMFLNRFFKGKNLFLFDTFSGFDDEDLKIELSFFAKEFNNSIFATNPFRPLDNQCTYEELVLQRMMFPDKVHIIRGHFPETAQYMHDSSFCLVHLDMDLYEPMLSGLRFFYSKLVPFGAMLLHDYYNPLLPGVKRALDTFENEINIKLQKYSIEDGSSIVIIRDDKTFIE